MPTEVVKPRDSAHFSVRYCLTASGPSSCQESTPDEEARVRFGTPSGVPIRMSGVEDAQLVSSS